MKTIIICLAFVPIWFFAITSEGFGETKDNNALQKLQKELLLTIGGNAKKIDSNLNKIEKIKNDNLIVHRLLSTENQKLTSTIDKLIFQLSKDREYFIEKSTGFNWDGLISPFFSALLAGILTALSAWRVLIKTHENDLVKLGLEEQKKIEFLLEALRSEIQSLLERYQAGVSYFKLEEHPEDKPIYGIMPLEQSYFTIYEGNANAIGSIKSRELINAIVMTYNQAKGLIDTWRLNNALNRKLSERGELIAQNNTEYGQTLYTESLQHLKEYSSTVIEYHNDTKREIENLIPQIDKYLSDKLVKV